jgi:hypothetical protein
LKECPMPLSNADWQELRRLYMTGGNPPIFNGVCF